MDILTKDPETFTMEDDIALAKMAEEVLAQPTEMDEDSEATESVEPVDPRVEKLAVKLKISAANLLLSLQKLIELGYYESIPQAIRAVEANSDILNLADAKSKAPKGQGE